MTGMFGMSGRGLKILLSLRMIPIFMVTMVNAIDTSYMLQNIGSLLETTTHRADGKSNDGGCMGTACCKGDNCSADKSKKRSSNSRISKRKHSRKFTKSVGDHSQMQMASEGSDASNALDKDDDDDQISHQEDKDDNAQHEDDKNDQISHQEKDIKSKDNKLLRRAEKMKRLLNKARFMIAKAKAGGILNKKGQKDTPQETTTQSKNGENNGKNLKSRKGDMNDIKWFVFCILGSFELLCVFFLIRSTSKQDFDTYQVSVLKDEWPERTSVVVPADGPNREKQTTIHKNLNFPLLNPVELLYANSYKTQVEEDLNDRRQESAGQNDESNVPEELRKEVQLPAKFELSDKVLKAIWKIKNRLSITKRQKFFAYCNYFCQFNPYTSLVCFRWILWIFSYRSFLQPFLLILNIPLYVIDFSVNSIAKVLVGKEVVNLHHRWEVFTEKSIEAISGSGNGTASGSGGNEADNAEASNNGGNAVGNPGAVGNAVVGAGNVAVNLGTSMIDLGNRMIKQTHTSITDSLLDPYLNAFERFHYEYIKKHHQSLGDRFHEKVETYMHQNSTRREFCGTTHVNACIGARVVHEPLGVAVQMGVTDQLVPSVSAQISSQVSSQMGLSSQIFAHLGVMFHSLGMFSPIANSISSRMSLPVNYSLAVLQASYSIVGDFCEDFLPSVLRVVSFLACCLVNVFIISPAYNHPTKRKGKNQRVVNAEVTTILGQLISPFATVFHEICRVESICSKICKVLKSPDHMLYMRKVGDTTILEDEKSNKFLEYPAMFLSTLYDYYVRLYNFILETAFCWCNLRNIQKATIPGQKVVPGSETDADLDKKLTQYSEFYKEHYKAHPIEFKSTTVHNIGTLLQYLYFPYGLIAVFCDPWTKPEKCWG